jgi:hypothetical protein
VGREPQRDGLGQGDVAGLAGFGRGIHKPAGDDTDLPAHVDDAAQEVDVIDGQTEALALPEPEAGRRRHDGLVAVRQRRCHRFDPLDRPGQDLAPVGGWRLDRPGPARIPGDDAVVDRRLQDGAQVGENDPDVARRELLLQAACPCLHDAGAQRYDLVVAKVRINVQPQAQRDGLPGRLFEGLGGQVRITIAAQGRLARPGVRPRPVSWQ